MKRILLLLFVNGVLLLLSGCWDRTEINEIAIVTATAIDKLEDDQIELSLQVFIPKAISSGGNQGQGDGSGGSSKEVTLVTSNQGVNIADALSKIQSELSRKVFWGQCKVFIFGEKIAMEGIGEHLDFLLRHPEPRERGFVFVSQGKAKSILELQTKLERDSSEAIRKTVNLGLGLSTTIQDLDEMLIGDAQAAALPLLKISTVEGKEGSYQFAEITGTAVLKKDKMVGNISEMETRGLLWLRNEIKEYTITVQPQDKEGSVSINLLTINIDKGPQIQNEEGKMNLKIYTEGAVVQNNTNLNLSDLPSMEIIEKAYQEDIKERIELVIKQVRQMNADIVDFAKVLHQKDPKQWNKVKNNWDRVFPKIEVNIEVEAYIRRQGYINEPKK